jgi:lactoylglutathione lyase
MASISTVRGLLAALALISSACTHEETGGRTSRANHATSSTAESQADAARAQPAVAPPTSEVAYIVLRVTDLPRSEAFYRDVLGMQQAFRYEIGNGAIEVAMGYPNGAGAVPGAAIVLLYQPNRADPFAHGTSYNRYVLAVPDVEATFQRLAKLGVPGLRMPVRYEQFKAIVGFATDPDGYTIEILQRIP